MQYIQDDAARYSVGMDKEEWKNGLNKFVRLEPQSQIKNDKENAVAMIKQAEKLFYLLREFLDKTPENNNDITDYLLVDLPKLLYLCKIHSLQPILYYMFLNNVDLLREHYPNLAKKMQSQYIASVYYSLQQDAETEEMADRFSRSGIPIVFF